ncbi:P1 family peptidase [Cyclobacterium sp.]|uniref:DmpA family aminopeptidase n=1 Tax=Cyclobacterium sp. TaxID=1966343 RepID=UPI0019BB93B6|nr:P1 family peptidase [Cyclobacterium sp.]MBD3630730.1 P1 family peptidase [Cyclobacterium sp.]
MRYLLILSLLTVMVHRQVLAQNSARNYGISLGLLTPGEWNAITDVPGVAVGQVTLKEGENIRTGVTAVLPHQHNLFQQKVPAAVFVGNGFGKLVGTTQIQELGNLESPIILTNTLSVAAGMEGILDHMLFLEGNENVGSLNAVVGETNDGYLNDIRGRHVKPDDVREAIKIAKGGPVIEGNVGAGTGTVCFGFKGGIGTSSRKLPESLGGFTVGVLVQSNFGGVLQIGGQPVGKILGQYSYKNQLESADGSCMIVVATDAPVDHRNLERIARRAIMGLARTGGIASNGSGDYVLAFSTTKEQLLTSGTTATLGNDQVTPLFLATIEATEEAIINSLFAAEDMKGKNGRIVKALPKEKVSALFRE